MVGIPTYNGSRHLIETLESVRRQTYPNLELIVVDDGSTDGSLELVQKIADLDFRVKVTRQANAGIAGARNRCFELGSSEAEYFLYLDHDDILEPDALDVLSGALSRRPDCVAAHGITAVIDEFGAPVQPEPALAKRLNLTRRRLRGSSLLDALRPAIPVTDDEDTTFDVLLYSNCITSMGAVLFRRSALTTAGGFNSEFVPVDDWDLYLRVALQGPFCYVPKKVLNWRLHDTNSSGNTIKMQSGYEKLLTHLSKTRYPEPFQRQIKAAALYRAAAQLASFRS